MYVLYNFVTREPTLISLYQGNSQPNIYHLFPALELNLGGHVFTEDRELEAVVTRRTVTVDRD